MIPRGSLARIAAIQLLAGLIWLLPIVVEPSGIPFWRGGEYSDLLISHWPNAWFIRRSLSEWGQLPLWNPMILGGAPFAADPLSGLWYPPNWLAVLFPGGPIFGLLMWLHLAWAGTGMWALLRRLRLETPGALVGSLAFSGTPKLIGHVGLGHLGLVSAVSWSPWVVLATVAAAEVAHVSLGESVRKSALAGALLGLSFLADPRWVLPLAALCTCVATWHTAHSHSWLGGWWNALIGGGATSLVGKGVIALGFSLAIGSILGFPLAEFTAHSTRAGLGMEETAASALPAAGLLGLLAPEPGGWPEWQAYLGICVVALALIGLWGREQGSIFWGCLAATCLLLALGNATPLHGLLSSIVPGYALLRVPARWLFAVAFGMAALAGIGLDRLLDDGVRERIRARFNLTAFGLLALVLALGMATGLGGGSAARNRALSHAISAGWLGAMILWVAIRSARGDSPRWLAFGLATIVTFDLALADISEIESRRLDPEQDATVTELIARSRPGSLERAFSPSYSLPQPAAALAGLELVDGINPLQLRGLRDYMAQATGFTPEGYSVTLPPFSQGDPGVPWGVQADAEQLGKLNVTYMASAYPVQQEGWGFAGVAGGAYLYRNGSSRPRAWVELEGPDGPWKGVQGLAWTPNRIRLQAEGPGLLVVSELAYPGWQVRVDGQEAGFAAGREPLRAVQLSQGAHQVELFYRPWTLFAGAAISLVGVALLAALWLTKA